MKISHINTYITKNVICSRFELQVASENEIRDFLFTVDENLLNTFNRSSNLLVDVNKQALIWIRNTITHYWVRRKHPRDNVYAIRRFEPFTFYWFMKKAYKWGHKIKVNVNYFLED